MADQLIGTFTGTLRTLVQKGVRFSTAIDLGCADGHFFLSHMAAGWLPDAVCVNIDANPIYENSLKTIKDAIGGHYLISAITDHVGEVELNTAAHHYWGSLLPDNDVYWRRLHDLRGDKIKVPATTLDAVAEQFDLKPPFLIKLDLQGTELKALRGASKVLSQTDVIICETAVDDFFSISEALLKSDLVLFDVTNLNWFNDNTFGWFYPVFINRRLEHIKSVQAWDRSVNDRVVQAQVDRQHQILALISTILAQLRAQQVKP